MTHVVHPYAHRLGKHKTWKSKWSFGVKNDYKHFLKTDTMVREFLDEKLKKFFVSDIQFVRDNDKKYTITIVTSRPGMIIGKGGDGIVKLTSEIKKFLKKNSLKIPSDLKIVIEDVHNPDSDTGVIVSQIVEALEKRMPFRRVMKSTLQKLMMNRDVKGAKISVSGRLGGSDMARKEYVKEGNIPLSTFRADVDYRTGRANLPYGVIGVKVWIYKGEIFDNDKK